MSFLETSTSEGSIHLDLVNSQSSEKRTFVHFRRSILSSWLTFETSGERSLLASSWWQSWQILVFLAEQSAALSEEDLECSVQRCGGTSHLALKLGNLEGETCASYFEDQISNS